MRPSPRLLLALVALTGCITPREESERERLAKIPPPPPPPANMPKQERPRRWRHIDDREEERPWWEEEKRKAPPREGAFHAEQGWYLGPLYGVTQHDDGDFDGQQFLTGPDMIVLPEIDTAGGPGAVLGYRLERMAFELTFLRTTHDAVWLGTPFDVTYQSFSVDFKNYFLLENRVQPYVTVGFALPILTVRNGSSMGAAVDDARFEDDLVIHAGVGLSIYLTRRLAVTGQAVYRFLETYDEAEGVAPKGPIAGVDGGGVTATVALTFTF